MEENMSDDENREESAKRLKTENNTSNEKSEESSSSSSNTTEQENASTSTDSGFPRVRNSRNRNYRNRKSSEGAFDITDEDRSPERAAVVDVATQEDMVTEEEDEAEGSPRDHLVNFLNDLAAGSDTTVIQDTDTESEEEHPVLKKPKPKHNWFVVPEMINRQIGTRAKYQSPELFQRRCYGSLRSVERLELMYKLEEHEGCVNSLNFHPNGSYLASGSDDLRVVVWDWKIGKCLLSYDTKHKTNVFQSKFLNLSGDLHIVTCARDGQVRIAQVSAQEGVRDNRKLGSHRGPCHKVALLPDQPHMILSAGEDGMVLSHDVRVVKPEKLVCVKENDREVALYSIHGHPLAQEFCVSGRDHMVRVYDQRKSGTPLSIYHPFKTDKSDILHVTCAVYNHDGSQILASYSDTDIYLFNADSEPGTFVGQYTGHRNASTIKGVNFFGPKSEFIVSGSDCGNVFFWEKNSEAIVQFMLADDNGVVNCLEPHPQLPFICTSGLDWDVKVWVPSCETASKMKDLPETLRNNQKLRNAFPSRADISESQMLWMLWRHLRSTSRMRHGGAAIGGSGGGEGGGGGGGGPPGDNEDGDDIFLQINTRSSSSSSSSSDSLFFGGDEDEDEDEDEMTAPIACSPS